VDPFSGQYSSRTAFGSVKTNIAFVKSQFERFGVGEHITIVPGRIVDLTKGYDLKDIEMLIVDADGCIDRELSYLFDRLSPDCTIVIDDIDDWLGISRANGRQFLDQKHRLSKGLVDAFVTAGILRDETRVQNTGFFRKGGTQVDAFQILSTALPTYRQLVFANIDHLPLHSPRTVKAWIGDNFPLARRLYRNLKPIFSRG
jgi:hypothetical protein